MVFTGVVSPARTQHVPPVLQFPVALLRLPGVPPTPGNSLFEGNLVVALFVRFLFTTTMPVMALRVKTLLAWM
jgi:hypothetical protein